MKYLPTHGIRIPSPKEYPGSSVDCRKIVRRGLSISYFGGYHTNDINDTIFERIKDEFNKAGDVTHILTEINVALPKEVNRYEDAVDYALEAGYLQLLARKSSRSIEWMGLDMTKTENFKLLLRAGVTSKEILLYEMFRRLGSSAKLNSVWDFQKDIIIDLYQEKKALLKKFNIDVVASLEDLLTEFPELFDIKSISYDWGSPVTRYKSPKVAEIVNRIVNLTSVHREVYMVSKILELAYPPNNLFVLSSHFHMWAQWGAIESALSSH